MKKQFLAIVNFCLIVTVSLATVLCCNFSATQTAAVGRSSVVMSKMEKAMPACHAQRNQADAPMRTDCNCCISKQLQAEQPTKISFNPAPIFSSYALLDVLSQQSFAPKAEFNLAYLNGPPGPISDTPLYIHLRNFRI